MSNRNPDEQRPKAVGRTRWDLTCHRWASVRFPLPKNAGKVGQWRRPFLLLVLHSRRAENWWTVTLVGMSRPSVGMVSPTST